MRALPPARPSAATPTFHRCSFPRSPRSIRVRWPWRAIFGWLPAFRPEGRAKAFRCRSKSVLKLPGTEPRLRPKCSLTKQETEMATQGKIDATRLLTEDHRKVEQLFEQFEKASGDGRKEKIAKQICTELKVHTIIEEEIFYPALRGKIEEDLLDEAYVEHDGAKMLINEIEAGGPDE